LTEAGPLTSRVGEYAGFSAPTHDGWARTSQYVRVRDGTRLAIDLFIPTRGGVVESQPLPLAWSPKRYLRATVVAGAHVPSFESVPTQGPVARLLLSRGYVVAYADMRGTGASFGLRSECSDPIDTLDGYDINEWLAAQSFCDGRVGMFGVSYEGRMQLDTASAAPPHLRAIVPEVSPFDWYHMVWQGGINRFEGSGARFRATDQRRDIAPVDEDLEGTLLAEALRVRAYGNDYSAMGDGLPHRDSLQAGTRPWVERSGAALIAGIVRSGIASYHRVGWFANVRLEQLLWFTNLARSATGPRHRLLVGPWPAGGVSPEHGEMWATETLRFLDYWVREIDNGIMDEPAIAYTTSRSTRERSIESWSHAASWPLPDTRSMEFRLDGGPSGSIRSVNDGSLDDSEGTTGVGRDSCRVDYQVGSPQGDGDPRDLERGADFTPFEEHCLTYSCAPLIRDLVVTGHPLLHLHVSCSGTDADLFVTLTDVDEHGISTFVTRHMLRLSHRMVAEAPYYFCGLPWHRGYEADSAPILPGDVVEVTMDLLPISYRFQAGHRLRLGISGGDSAHARGGAAAPGSVIEVWHDDRHRSRLMLPVVGDASDQ